MNQNQVTAGHLTEIIYFTYQNGCLFEDTEKKVVTWDDHDTN